MIKTQLRIPAIKLFTLIGCIATLLILTSSVAFSKQKTKKNSRVTISQCKKINWKTKECKKLKYSKNKMKKRKKTSKKPINEQPNTTEE